MVEINSKNFIDDTNNNNNQNLRVLKYDGESLVKNNAIIKIIIKGTSPGTKETNYDPS